jgi:RasGEF N-terminal motif
LCSQAAVAAPIYEQAGGPLDPLLAKMVPTDDYFPDRAFLFAFLLSARLFVQPHELLKRIMRLCDPKVRERLNLCVRCADKSARAKIQN